jgi:opacity protein-like surface antigen
MKKTFLLLVTLCSISVLSLAQDRPRFEFFGGYQYSSLDIHDAQNALNQLTTAQGLPRLSLGNRMSANGWDMSLQENPSKSFGLVFDISGAYTKKDVNLAPLVTLPAGATAVMRLKPSFYTFTGGPQFTYRKNSRFQPFGRVLLGLGYSRASGNVLMNDVPQLKADLTQSENAFAFVGGGGFDYHFENHLAFRAAGDYIRTYFSNLNQNNVRASVGLAYRWTNAMVF